MDAYDLIRWREIQFGLDRRRAAQALGISLNSLRNYEESKTRIPPYIPLLCAAVTAGIKPWTLPPDLLREKRANPVVKPSAAPRGYRHHDKDWAEKHT